MASPPSACPAKCPPGLTDPIAEFDHDEGIAVIGVPYGSSGVVQRLAVGP